MASAGPGTLSSAAMILEHLDLAYGTASATQRLDLYVPAAGGPHPLVAWFHGGGWFMGSRALAANAAQRHLVGSGYALASVGYRLSGEAKFPAQLEDATSAVQWLRAHAGEYGLDGWVAAWGESAGGHLAALLGVTAQVQAVIDWYGPTDFLQLDAQTAAQGCPRFGEAGHDGPDSPESRLVGFPIQEDPARVRRANPVAYVSGREPPFLLQHGDRDCTVPPAQSRVLYDALRAHGVPAQLEILPAGHGGAAFTARSNLERLCAFLAGARSR